MKLHPIYNCSVVLSQICLRFCSGFDMSRDAFRGGGTYRMIIILSSYSLYKRIPTSVMCGPSYLCC